MELWAEMRAGHHNCNGLTLAKKEALSSPGSISSFGGSSNSARDLLPWDIFLSLIWAMMILSRSCRRSMAVFWDPDSDLGLSTTECDLWSPLYSVSSPIWLPLYGDVCCRSRGFSGISSLLLLRTWVDPAGTRTFLHTIRSTNICSADPDWILLRLPISIILLPQMIPILFRSVIHFDLLSINKSAQNRFHHSTVT